MATQEGSTPPHTGAEHTAEHILMRSVQMTKGEVKVKKVEFNRGGGTVFFESDDLTMEEILQAEKMCNKIIQEGRAVNTFFFVIRIFFVQVVFGPTSCVRGENNCTTLAVSDR